MVLVYDLGIVFCGLGFRNLKDRLSPRSLRWRLGHEQVTGYRI
jgi:hypothetical protein